MALPSGRFLQPFWDLVSSLWAAPAQEGCGMDPSGRCLQQQPKLDAGCGMDPNGWCQPQPQLDEGCGMDPDGKCHAGS
ncbi:MAG TPA: hypothetical protein VLV54_10780 [Thermoanaerobaculia bacterium]|nr:hypothetical protein [Thermoanaerobaculia bacterium]